jgi:uncharacterized membrane protein YidH (DUF202 family)
MSSGPGHPEPPEPGSPGGDSTEDREPEERDAGLARERTALAWTRTAIAFAALGGAVLKENVVSGLIILAIAPMVWELGRISHGKSPGTSLSVAGTTRIRLITVSIVAVALLSLVVALVGRSAPGALR